MPENQMPPSQTPPPTQPAPTPGSNESQARMWNMLCHLGGLVPCIPCVCTLLIWQIKKNEFPSVEVHGKTALNFQITMLVIIAGIKANNGEDYKYPFSFQLIK
jgi:hypothetical protein